MEKQYLFQIMNALTRSMENLHKKEMLAYMNKKLSSLYIMDTLTGMYNRMGYQQLGEKAFRISRRNGRRLLILFVDLDRLKYINDTFGHEYGDMAICAAARALMQCSSVMRCLPGPAAMNSSWYRRISPMKPREIWFVGSAEHWRRKESTEATIPADHEYRNGSDRSGQQSDLCRLCKTG